MAREMDGKPIVLCVYHPGPPQSRSSSPDQKCDNSVRTVETETEASCSSFDDDGTLSSTSSYGKNNRSAPQRRSSRVLEKRRSERKQSSNPASENNDEMPRTSFSFRKTLIQMGSLSSEKEKNSKNDKENSKNAVPRPRRQSSFRRSKSSGPSEIKRPLDQRPPMAKSDANNTSKTRRPSKRLQELRASMVEQECQLREMISSNNKTRRSSIGASPVVYDMTAAPNDDSLLKSEDGSGATMRHHSDSTKLCEMRASLSQQRNQLIDMLGNTKSKIAAEPVVCDDLRGELASSYELITQQREQIKTLEEKCAKLEESTAQVSVAAEEETNNYEEELLAKDRQLAELHARLTQLEIDRAWGELQLRNKITKDSQEYEKALKKWQKEATSWKMRFEELWNKSQPQRLQPPQQEAAGSSQPQSGAIQANLLMSVMKLKRPEPVLDKTTTSTPYATGEDQANLLKNVMNQNKKSRFGGGGAKKPTEPSPDAILLERLRVENEMLRRELCNLQSQQPMAQP